MARLEGKHSNAGIYLILVLIVLVLAAILALEYFGYVNWIPNFGPDFFRGI